MIIPKPAATYADFEKLDLRAGRITTVEPFPAARRPAYKLTIDFGPEVGVKRASAQITEHYTPDSLIGKVVVAVVNFAPKRIADFTSEVLVLGAADVKRAVALLTPDREIPLGARIF